MKWEKGRRYQIIYLDQNNQISSRYIKVIHVREHALLAYCFEKQGIRSFLKDGILGVKRLNDMRDFLPDKKYN